MVRCQHTFGHVVYLNLSRSDGREALRRERRPTKTADRMNAMLGVKYSLCEFLYLLMNFC